MRYLITGGRGFVGEWVVRKLEREGNEVVIMSNLSHPSEESAGRKFSYGDVRYAFDVDKAVRDVDVVIHLAARINVDRSREFADPFFETNVRGTYNVLEACRKFKKKLVMASTSEALGSMRMECCGLHTPDKKDYKEGEYFSKTGIMSRGMNEAHPYSPDNPYGATKAAADMLAIGWHKSFGVDVTILRSFNITGIGQSFDKEGAFVPKVINKVINGENPTIFGAGDQTRDYVYVADVADAYYRLSMGNYAGEIFHVGSGKEVSIKQVAEKLIDISGKDLEIEYLPGRPQEVKRLLCDNSKIRSIGWVPTKGIDDILREMYNYAMMKEIGVTDLDEILSRRHNERMGR